MFRICISDSFLDMCSKPFVMFVFFMSGLLASTKVQLFSFSNEAFDRVIDPW